MPKKSITYSNFDDTYNLEVSQPNLREACIRVFQNDNDSSNETSILLSKDDIADLIQTLTELEKDMQT